MSWYRRRLPHWIPDDAILFVTWRLAGSQPPRAPEVLTVDNTGRAPFIRRHQGLDQLHFGPTWLRDPRVAGMLVNAIQHGETVRRFYDLYAWVIMPNHVHTIFRPRVAMPYIMRWLKGTTGRRANRILGRVGTPFWQDESFDHWIRTSEELNYLIAYVESNPVKAGLIGADEPWPWSSARFLADDKQRSSAPHDLAQK